MFTPPGLPPPSAATLTRAVDALGWPLLLLRADATLLHANRAALAVLARGEPLLLSTERRVLATDRPRRRAFDDACEAVLGGAPPALLHWPAGAGTRRMWASLSLLAGADNGEDALLLALSPEAGLGFDLKVFADTHGLSPAETRVLARLALGESSVAAAATLGLSAATVRSHAQSLCRKTGHARVADLVHTLACMPPLGIFGPQLAR